MLPWCPLAVNAHLVALAAAWGLGGMVAVRLPGFGLRWLLLAAWRRHMACCAVVGFSSLWVAAGMASLRALTHRSDEMFSGWVTLLDDPRPVGLVGAVVTVRDGSRRLTAIAHGAVAARLDDALAGERLFLLGRLKPLNADDTYSRWRHVVGRLTVTAVDGQQSGSPVNPICKHGFVVL